MGSVTIPRAYLEAADRVSEDARFKGASKLLELH